MKETPYKPPINNCVDCVLFKRTGDLPLCNHYQKGHIDQFTRIPDFCKVEEIIVKELE